MGGGTRVSKGFRKTGNRAILTNTVNLKCCLNFNCTDKLGIYRNTNNCNVEHVKSKSITKLHIS